MNRDRLHRTSRTLESIVAAIPAAQPEANTTSEWSALSWPDSSPRFVVDAIADELEQERPGKYIADHTVLAVRVIRSRVTDSLRHE